MVVRHMFCIPAACVLGAGAQNQGAAVAIMRQHHQTMAHVAIENMLTNLNHHTLETGLNHVSKPPYTRNRVKPRLQTTIHSKQG